MTNRRIVSTFLLAIILPIIFLAPFHHHDEPLSPDISCDACAHHEPHPGHLSENPGTHDCLICQLLGQQYVPSVGPAIDRLSSALATEMGLEWIIDHNSVEKVSIYKTLDESAQL